MAVNGLPSLFPLACCVVCVVCCVSCAGKADLRGSVSSHRDTGVGVPVPEDPDRAKAVQDASGGPPRVRRRRLQRGLRWPHGMYLYSYDVHDIIISHDMYLLYANKHLGGCLPHVRGCVSPLVMVCLSVVPPQQSQPYHHGRAGHIMMMS